MLPNLDGVPIYITVFISILTLLGGGFGMWLLNIFKQRRDLNLADRKQDMDAKLASEKQIADKDIAENQQALVIYQEIVRALQADRVSLREDINKFEAKYDTLEKEHLHCREQYATLVTKSEHQQEQIVELKTEIAQLKAKFDTTLITQTLSQTTVTPITPQTPAPTTPIILTK